MHTVTARGLLGLRNGECIGIYLTARWQDAFSFVSGSQETHCLWWSCHSVCLCSCIFTLTLVSLVSLSYFFLFPPLRVVPPFPLVRGSLVLPCRPPQSPCHALIHKDTLWGQHNLAITGKSISRSKYNSAANPNDLTSTVFPNGNI